MKALTAFLLGLLMLMAPVAAVTVQDVRANYQQAKSEYASTRRAYTAAKDEYQQLRKGFITAKNKYLAVKNAENRDELVDESKDFFLRSLDYMIRHLDKIENGLYRADWVDEDQRATWISTIDGYQADLESLKSEVNEAETLAELKEISDRIRTKWREIRPSVKSILGQIANEKISALLERTKGVSGKLRTIYDTRVEMELPVADVGERLDTIDEKIASAEDHYENAKALYQGATSLAEMDAALREANREMMAARKDLRAAHGQLKYIYRMFRRYRTAAGTGSVVKSGTGSIEASGDGVMTIEGSAEIELVAESGTLTITDTAGDAEIEISGSGNKTEDDDTTTYVGMDGSASISGSDIEVTIDGTAITLYAEGTGTATLAGTGFYKVGGVEKELTSAGTVITVQPAVVSVAAVRV